MSERIAVIGDGVCGLSASWVLAQAGINSTLFGVGGGETRLSSGALDFVPWVLNQNLRQPNNPHRQTLEFFERLALFRFPSTERPSSLVASSLGQLRPACAVARGVLDLLPHAGRCIAVADVGRDDFDAHWLSRSYSEHSWAQATGTRFEPVSLREVFEPAELKWPYAAFIRILNHPPRMARALDQLVTLRGKRSELRAVLVGPWLGDGPSFELVHNQLQSEELMLGETLHPPEGSFGTRYDQAKRRLLENSAEIDTEVARVTALVEEKEGVSLEWEVGAQIKRARFRAAILATGGLLGGGVEMKLDAWGEHRGWTIGRCLKPQRDLAGKLAGWDPSVQVADWLNPGGQFGGRAAGVYASIDDGPDSRLGSQLIISAPDLSIGTGTLGMAAERGRLMAQQILDRLT